MKKYMLGFLLATMLALVAAVPVKAVPIPGPEVGTLGLSLVLVDGEIECTVGASIVDGPTYEIEGIGKVVVANNEEGNILFQCIGELVDEPPSHALRFNSDKSVPLGCFDGTTLVDSLNWQLQITPSGQGMFNCHVNPAVESPF